ncbi:hypothetical protein Leryth_014806 [Lithospermum erythrorhizon]|nr:hypothetical protein Leryth_014806 [Lithospermum erythrorhizon]
MIGSSEDQKEGEGIIEEVLLRLERKYETTIKVVFMKGRSENVGIVVGLIGVQFMYALNAVVLSYLMLLGFRPPSLIILSNFATFLVLAPFSIYLERDKWPKSFSIKLWIQLLLVAYGSVTLFQSMFIEGIKLTSPAMATAMPNLAPGLIFFIAWAFRFEEVKLSCIYSKTKIMGTLMCVVGAIVMSLLQSTTDESGQIIDMEKLDGSLYLMAAVLVLSSSVVLQAATLKDLPAPITLCSITSLMGVVMTGIIEFLRGEKFEDQWLLMDIQKLIGFTIVAGFISGGCVSLTTWAMKKRGPVLVSMFSPIATVISVILSSITLGQTISLGSLAGMFLMFTGLYSVLWAKGKEGFPLHDNQTIFDVEFDQEKPLLS